MLRGSAVLETVSSHVLLGAHVVLHLQAPVEDGILLCRSAKQRKHLVKGKLSRTRRKYLMTGVRRKYYLLKVNQIEWTFCTCERGENCKTNPGLLWLFQNCEL